MPFRSLLRRALAAVVVAQIIGGCSGRWPSGRTGADPVAPPGTSGSPAGNPGGTGISDGLLAGNSGATLIGNTGAALIGNTGAAFAGTVRGPVDLIGNTGAALVGNTGAAYWLSALTRSPLAGAFIYLTDPDERFYTVGGRTLTTTTDAAGRYDFGKPVVPEGKYVVVNAMLAKNLRLVGFTVSVSGQNQVDVDLATTYVLEFLRSEARRDSKTFDDYDLKQLPGLVRATAELLESGRLGLVPDHLVVGQSSYLVDAYAAAIARHSPELRKAWRLFLGRPAPTVLRFAGTGRYGLNSQAPTPALEAPVYSPLGIATRGEVTYLALLHSHQINGISGNGSMAPITAALGSDPSLAPVPPVPASGSATLTSLLPQPVAIAADHAGNLFVALNSPVDHPRNQVLMLCRDPSPVFGLERLEPGRIYPVAGTLEPRTDTRGFSQPSALALDGAGNLFVADQRNDRIMRIDRQSGDMLQVAGIDPLAPFANLIDREVRALSSPLFAPAGLAWMADGADEKLFVVDTLFQRIRVVRAPGGNWRAATMATLAGGGDPITAGSASVVQGGFFGDGESALNARFHFALVDTVDYRGSEVAWPGLAVDPDRRRLYVADRLNRRIRAIDLVSGSVSTVAGGGQETGEGLAAHADFGMPTGLALMPGGDLLVTDPIRNVVWRLILEP